MNINLLEQKNLMIFSLIVSFIGMLHPICHAACAAASTAHSVSSADQGGQVESAQTIGEQLATLTQNLPMEENYFLQQFEEIIEIIKTQILSSENNTEEGNAIDTLLKSISEISPELCKAILLTLIKITSTIKTDTYNTDKIEYLISILEKKILENVKINNALREFVLLNASKNILCMCDKVSKCRKELLKEASLLGYIYKTEYNNTFNKMLYEVIRLCSSIAAYLLSIFGNFDDNDNFASSYMKVLMSVYIVKCIHEVYPYSANDTDQDHAIKNAYIPKRLPLMILKEILKSSVISKIDSPSNICPTLYLQFDTLIKECLSVIEGTFETNSSSIHYLEDLLPLTETFLEHLIKSSSNKPTGYEVFQIFKKHFLDKLIIEFATWNCTGRCLSLLSNLKQLVNNNQEHVRNTKENKQSKEAAQKVIKAIKNHYTQQLYNH